ncbi:MAG: ABC transporter permease subunit [Methylobacteriaceae bacterium]|nr:ABC transporter permease subunit [Methylobacteriaceae bacterium]
MTPISRFLRALTANLPSPRGFIPLLALLGLWQIVQPSPSPYFPPPTIWISSLAAIPASDFLSAIGETLVSFIAGLALATMLGFFLGVLIGYSPVMRRALGPLLEFMRALPPPTIVPIAVLLIGYDERMKLAVITLSAIWPVMMHTAASVGAIPALLDDVVATFRLSHREAITKIVIPAAIPGLLLGVRIAMPLALIVALLVEILTAIPGLGGLMIMAQRNFNAGQVFGLLLVIGVCGFVINALFQVVETAVLQKWPPRNQQQTR